MKKTALVLGVMLVLTVALTFNAYAGGEGGGSGWNDFWTGVGGFVHNALPWNWGEWMGSKSA
jgi:hypothetical protein